VQAVDVPILVYHRFGPRVADSMTVRTQVFESQLKQIEDGGFRVIPLRQLVDHLAGRGPPPPPRSVAITVDDAHRTVYTELLPLARKKRLPVTLFVYPSVISNASYAMTWAQLAELRASGLFDIQSHTYWHPHFFRERRRLEPEAYARFVDWQLAKSKQVLEAKLGGQVDLLAWPFGLHDDELKARAAKAGYVAAFTLERRPARSSDDPLAVPRYLITDAQKGPFFDAILKAPSGSEMGIRP
jgi:peptidoglycan/xylan/chitin deacetylase (PgdA/CDA1 family)